jgi:hypothetical protein
MLSELLNLPTAELAHRLATVAVEARARKVAAAKQAAGMFDQAVAGAKDLWSSAQPTLQAYGSSLKNLDVSNPAVAATLGAAALGGGSAIGESFRRKDRRRWSNVAVNAALGGLMGGAAPLAIGGVRSWLTPGADAPPPAPGGAAGGAPGADASKPTLPPTLVSGWDTPPGTTPPTMLDRGLNTIRVGGQVAAGGSDLAAKNLDPTNTNLDAARAGLGATKLVGEAVRDNPATTAGAVGSAALMRHNSRWADRYDLDRGFSRLMGVDNGPHAAADKVVPKVPDLEPRPVPPKPYSSTADAKAYAAADAAYRTAAAEYPAKLKAYQDAIAARAKRVQGLETWATQANRQRHTTAGTALRRGFGGATPADFQALRTSGGPSSFWGRTAPRYATNAAPALIGILMDHLSTPQNMPK